MMHKNALLTTEALVIASHNAGKVREFSALLAPLDIDVIPAAALQLEEPEETGATFAENAAIKAHAAAKAAQKPALADDSGLAIPALGGAPGVYSARWAEKSKDFTIAFARIEKELSAKGLDARARPVPAYFICALCLAYPDGKAKLFEGRVDGTLTFPARGAEGFGYDPIFIPQGHNQTFAQMDLPQKQALSHRARAFAKLMDYLQGGA